MASAIQVTFPAVSDWLPYIPLSFIRESIKAYERTLGYAAESITRYQNLLASDPTRAKFTVFTKAFQAEDNDNLTFKELLCDAAAFIVGGSDTTANTLTYLVWSVSRHPGVKAKLMKELNSLADDYTDQQVQKLPYLNQVIKETLRLYPAVPAGLPRVVPPSGASLGGYWVPGGSTVSAQAYSLHRDPVVFPEPERFIPERWEKVTSEMKASFMSFGFGSRGKFFCLYLVF